MSSVREQVLAAIAQRLETFAGLTVRRNEALPEKIPTGGLAILRDGDPGNPDVVLSNLSDAPTHEDCALPRWGKLRHGQH